MINKVGISIPIKGRKKNNKDFQEKQNKIKGMEGSNMRHNKLEHN